MSYVLSFYKNYVYYTSSIGVCEYTTVTPLASKVFKVLLFTSMLQYLMFKYVNADKLKKSSNVPEIFDS